MAKRKSGKFRIEMTRFAEAPQAWAEIDKYLDIYRKSEDKSGQHLRLLFQIEWATPENAALLNGRTRAREEARRG